VKQCTETSGCVEGSSVPVRSVVPGDTITLGPVIMRSHRRSHGPRRTIVRHRLCQGLQAAAKPGLPSKGNVFSLVKYDDKSARSPISPASLGPGLGFRIFIIIHERHGECSLPNSGSKTTRLHKIDEGRPTAVDMIKNGPDPASSSNTTPRGMIPRNGRK